MSVLFIDNFDSFAHNLARYFRLLGQATRVVRNNAILVEDILATPPAAIVLSPGPKSPREAGICIEVVRRCGGSIPILGVCLGHQSIGAAFGGPIVRTAPMHGRKSPIEHDGVGLFAGLPSPIEVARYHSLVIDAENVPEPLRVTARTPDGIVMAVEHRTQPTFGLQFHPESVLTPTGFHLLRNFLVAAGLTDPQSDPQLATRLIHQELPQTQVSHTSPAHDATGHTRHAPDAPASNASSTKETSS